MFRLVCVYTYMCVCMCPACVITPYRGCYYHYCYCCYYYIMIHKDRTTKPPPPIAATSSHSDDVTLKPRSINAGARFRSTRTVLDWMAAS
jgi:hypothetical protein